MTLVEVGGSAEYQDSRAVFFDDISGILLVFDASVDESFAELQSWMSQIASHLLSRELQYREEESRKGSGAGGRARKGGAGAAMGTATPAAAGMRQRAGAGAGTAAEAGPGSSYSSSAAATAAASHEPPYRTVARRLQEIPKLVLANKCDRVGRGFFAVAQTLVSQLRTLVGRPGPSSSQSQSGLVESLLQHNNSSNSSSSGSRVKIAFDIPTESTSEATICGCALRRPRMHRVTVEAPVVPVVAVADRDREDAAPPATGASAMPSPSYHSPHSGYSSRSASVASTSSIGLPRAALHRFFCEVQTLQQRSSSFDL